MSRKDFDRVLICKQPPSWSESSLTDQKETELQLGILVEIQVIPGYIQLCSCIYIHSFIGVKLCTKSQQKALELVRYLMAIQYLICFHREAYDLITILVVSSCHPLEFSGTHDCEGAKDRSPREETSIVV